MRNIEESPVGDITETLGGMGDWIHNEKEKTESPGKH